MGFFRNQQELTDYLERLGPLYAQYGQQLWERGVRCVQELESATREALWGAGVRNSLHIDHIKAAAAAGGPYLGSATDGIQARPIHSKRVETCNLLLARVSSIGFVVLGGPPGSGKTSLLQLVGHTAVPWPFSRVFYVNCANVANGASWEQHFEEQTGHSWQKVSSIPGGGAASAADTLPGLLLIDELQCLYRDPQRFSALWGYMKCLGMGDSRVHLRILAATVFGSGPSDADWFAASATASWARFDCIAEQRVGLRPANAGDPGLALTPDEFSDLWQQLWRDCGLSECELFLDNTIKDAMYHVTAGQVGLIVFMTDYLTERFKQATSDPSFDRAKAAGLGDKMYREMFRSGYVYSALMDTRAFLKFDPLSSEQAAYWKLFQRLLVAEDGVMEGAFVALLNSEQCSLVADLHRRGYLHLYRSRRTHVEYYAFHTPLHLLYYQHQLLHARVSEVPEPAHPQTLENFLHACIPQMLGSHGQLRSTVSAGSTGRLLERQLQLSFVMAALSVLPLDFKVCPDVGKVCKADDTVDFWITPVNWAIQLLWDGTNMDKHEQWFQPGSEYADMPNLMFAVLDFRSKPAPEPLPSKLSTSYQVTFAADYSTAKMTNQGQTWEFQAYDANI